MSPRPTKEQKDKRIMVFIPPPAAEKLQAIADKKGLAVSAMLRMLAFELIEKEEQKQGDK